MLMPVVETAFTPSMLRAQRVTTSSLSVTKRTFSPVNLKLLMICATSLVLAAARLISSSTNNSFVLTLSLNADFTARRRALRGIFCSYERGWGPHTVPPPTHNGLRVLPTRARPVPFCFQGFLPPPRTRPRVLVACVP